EDSAACLNIGKIRGIFNPPGGSGCQDSGLGPRFPGYQPGILDKVLLRPENKFMREFTVIVPTWNMGRYLPALFRSVVNSPFAQDVEEIIFACEKSTDGSERIIAD